MEKVTGGKRYQCQGFNKTFNELTDTTIHRLKKTDEFREFIEQMFEGDSIRAIAKRLSLSSKIVFDWRQKTLESFSGIFTKRFKGIVETDDVIMELNQKGRKNNFLKIGK